MQLKTYLSSLWFLALALQLILVIVLVAKQTLRKFPIFFAYTVFCFLAAALEYAVHSSRVLYFYTYWTCEGIGLLLGFGVVYEIFKTLLVPYPALRRVATVIFQASVLLLVILGIVVVLARPSAVQNGLMAFVLVAEESTRVVELGLLMFLFLFSSAFGLHWRQSVFGITLGLGLFAAVELIGVALRIHLGMATAVAQFAMVRPLAFNTSLLVWLGWSSGTRQLWS
jgi:hypothetical protein